MQRSTVAVWALGLSVGLLGGSSDSVNLIWPLLIVSVARIKSLHWSASWVRAMWHGWRVPNT